MTYEAPKYSPFSHYEKRPPLGLGFLTSVLKKRGHKVFFIDNYLKPSNILETNFLNKNYVDFVGIYSTTTCYESTLKMLNKLNSIRQDKIWNGKIIVGGPHTSVGASEIPEYIDYIVIGEGENIILDIVENNIKERIINGVEVIDLDTLPIPAWEEFVHLSYSWREPWIDAYPIYTLNTSRGCPFNCKFCSVKAIWGRTYRYMSAQRIVDDIKYLMKYYGARGIYFREDNFTLNTKRIEQFCEILLRQKIEIDWICETRVDSLTDYNFQKLMNEAGCKAFFIGVESGSQRMLDFYRKGVTVEQFIKAFEIAKKVGIRTYASYIIGTYEETKQDKKLTKQLLKNIKPDFIGRNIYVGIPGSEIYDYMLSNKLYDYKDKTTKILFVKGHNRLVNRYYHGNPTFKYLTLSRGAQMVLWKIFWKIKESMKMLMKEYFKRTYIFLKNIKYKVKRYYFNA